MKVVAYKDVTEAVTVAKAVGGRLIQVGPDLASNLQPSEQGFIVAANAKDLYDEAGDCFHVRVRCHRTAKGEPGTDEYLAGKFELFLEKVDQNG